MACVGVNGSPLTKRVRAGDRPMAMQYGKIPGLPKKVSRVVRSALQHRLEDSLALFPNHFGVSHAPTISPPPTLRRSPLTRVCLASQTPSSRCTGHCFCTRLTDRTLSSTRSGTRGAMHSTVQRCGVASFFFVLLLAVSHTLADPVSLVLSCSVAGRSPAPLFVEYGLS